MGARKQDIIYQELGELLFRTRVEKYRSALAMHREGKFSFSYAAYADFERGAALPSPAALLELCTFLTLDEKVAFATWARVQMPTEDLKALFSPETFLRDRRSQQGRRDSEKNNPALVLATDPRMHQEEFENTWVFGIPERDAILKEPRLMEMFIHLSIIHPRAVKLEDMGFRTSKDKQIFIERHLRRWIDEKRIEVTERGVRLMAPFIYMPRNEVFDQVRQTIVTRALEKTLPELTVHNINNRLAHRSTVNRYVSPKQREFMMEKLAGIEREFSRLPYTKPDKSDETTKNHTLLIFCTPRKLEWPR
ncbi:MAG TPA: hypothetical protein PLH57_12270 [Oligoflexia bacterium]|nr:hypothetical protein [Oligoflexia bacterium]